MSWFGLSAPANTPKPIIDKLNAEAVNTLQSPEFNERMVKSGFVVVGNTPEEFMAFVAAETKKWADVIKKGGIKAEWTPEWLYRPAAARAGWRCAGGPGWFGSMEKVK